MKFSEVTAPKYANEEGTVISMTVLFESFEEPVAFAASPLDPEPHGQELYERAKSGDFGDIAAYEPPPVEVLEDLARIRKAALMASAGEQIAPLQDAVDLGEASDSELEALRQWKAYRVALNRIEQQEGYPGAIAWPDQPAT